MNTLIAEYWIWLVVALVLGLLVAWYVFHASRRTNVTGASKDVLDEGADRAQRNRALIDSAPAASGEASGKVDQQVVPVSAPTGLGGTGAAVAVAADEAELGMQARERVEPKVEDHEAVMPDSAPTAGAEGDDLTRIKGVGPKLAARLRELEVTTFDQIAAWDDPEIDRIDAQLGRFEGRIRRDAWVEQAGLLSAGDTGAYQERFGKLD